MLLFAMAAWVVGYDLAYAGIKGAGATIDGTPLWRAPWLPFVKALTGGTSTGTISTIPNASDGDGGGGGFSTGGGNGGGGGGVTATGYTPTLADIANDTIKALQTVGASFRNGVRKAAGA